MIGPHVPTNGLMAGSARVLTVDWPRDCGAVIPCLNEAGSIGPLVRDVRKHVPTVIVVDDGSTDGTALAASAAGAHVVRHPTDQGKGAALRTGLEWLGQRGFSWALLMDGDGQHAAEDIPLFLDHATNRRVNLLVGNRMDNAAAMPWLRRVTNRCMSARLSRLAGRTLPDSQCGFRLMEIAPWKQLELTTSHFEIESELLMAFVDSGYSVEFIPVRVIYGNEQTKIAPLQDGWRWLAWLWRAYHRRRSIARQNAVHPTVASSKAAV